MSAHSVRNASLAYGPLVKSTADATGARGVFRESAVASAQTDTIPSAWVNAWVTLCARGTVVQYAFVLKGETAPTIAIDQVAQFGTGHAAAGFTILEDSQVQVMVPAKTEKIVWICSTANAGEYFEGYLSGPKKVTVT